MKVTMFVKPLVLGAIITVAAAGCVHKNPQSVTKLPEGARIVLCDERGKSLASADFAADIAAARDSGETAYVLVIGGPDGLDANLRAEAKRVIAFGAMTWPHQLARIMAAEQAYRALTILAGHPYHRL